MYRVITMVPSSFFSFFFRFSTRIHPQRGTWRAWSRARTGSVLRERVWEYYYRGSAVGLECSEFLDCSSSRGPCIRDIEVNPPLRWGLSFGGNVVHLCRRASLQCSNSTAASGYLPGVQPGGKKNLTLHKGPSMQRG